MHHRRYSYLPLAIAIEPNTALGEARIGVNGKNREAVGVRAHLVISGRSSEWLVHGLVAAAAICCDGRFGALSQVEKARSGAGRRAAKERAPGNGGQSTATRGGRKARRQVAHMVKDGREYIVKAGESACETGKEFYERGKELAEDARERIESGLRAVR